MRPYLAIIADSFRSALASRILWVALATIYIFLIALAPIGYREVFTTRFSWLDFANGTRMKAMLARAIDEPTNEETPAGRIARQLPDELQRNLQKVAQGQEVRIHLHIFADGLNARRGGLIEVANTRRFAHEVALRAFQPALPILPVRFELALFLIVEKLQLRCDVPTQLRYDARFLILQDLQHAV